MIDITNVDLRKLIKEAYSLSSPQGLGFIHYEPGELTDSEIEEIYNRSNTISMDYVKGRAVKLHVRKTKDGRLELNDSWYDHSDSQYKELLNRLGIENV